ncbi:MAG: hypothetical protein HY077_09245 [Elusimicrobia bacterium]|nr:hypothetical protein [Elusimicrobiota bacterium]
MLQPNGLDIDLGGTLAAHEAFARGWDAAVEREASFIRRSGARLVVGDIPPLAFAAASRAGVLSVALANFSWDWILSLYAAREPRWKPIVALYRRSYSLAGALLRLPMHGDFPAFRKIEDIPLVVSRSPLGKRRAREILGLARGDRRSAVLLSFGGFGTGPLDLSSPDDLSAFVFVGFGPRPPGLRADWIEFPPRAPVPHVDIVAGCDAVIGKPGYGTFSEAVAHRCRTLRLPRRDFREVPRMTRWMKESGLSVEIRRADFYAGRWKRDLERLFALKGPWPRVRLDGSEAVARRLSAFA